MARKALIPNGDEIQDSNEAQAFEVYAALCRAERDAPWLYDNPRWQIIVQDAYADFWFTYMGGPE